MAAGGEQKGKRRGRYVCKWRHPDPGYQSVMRRLEQRAVRYECTELWLAVLDQALFDLCHCSGLSPLDQRYVAEAPAWWGSQDFRIVCAFLGLDPEWTLSIVRAYECTLPPRTRPVLRKYKPKQQLFDPPHTSQLKRRRNQWEQRNAA